MRTRVSAKIKVLIVDSSAAVRRALSDMLLLDPGIEVQGIAADPFSAVRRIRNNIPDVILLDHATQRMDGLTFLKKIMFQHPIPVVMMISQTTGNEVAQKATLAGAVGIIIKSDTDTAGKLREISNTILEAVYAAATSKMPVPKNGQIIQSRALIKTKFTADIILPSSNKTAVKAVTEPLVCIGASTGGTESLYQVLVELTIDCPGIVIVQHMPQFFTASFARRLDSLCSISVKEAETGDVVTRGHAFIAPGGKHTLIERISGSYVLQVRNGPPVSRHCPSVDVLFRSASVVAGPNAIGVIMTGMGDDGARGLGEMKQSGAYTIAQDEATSVVFGMPKEAIRIGAADQILPLDRIASEIMNATR